MCSEVLQWNPENVNALKDRAEAYIQEEHYEEGKSDSFLKQDKNMLTVDPGRRHRAECVQM